MIQRFYDWLTDRAIEHQRYLHERADAEKRTVTAQREKLRFEVFRLQAIAKNALRGTDCDLRSALQEIAGPSSSLPFPNAVHIATDSADFQCMEDANDRHLQTNSDRNRPEGESL